MTSTRICLHSFYSQQNSLKEAAPPKLVPPSFMLVLPFTLSHIIYKRDDQILRELCFELPSTPIETLEAYEVHSLIYTQHIPNPKCQIQKDDTKITQTLGGFGDQQRPVCGRRSAFWFSAREFQNSMLRGIGTSLGTLDLGSQYKDPGSFLRLDQSRSLRRPKQFSLGSSNVASPCAQGQSTRVRSSKYCGVDRVSTRLRQNCPRISAGSLASAQ